MEYKNSLREAVIFGGGHVSLATAKLLKFIGFRVTVADDRTEFANVERFSMVDKVICAPFEKAVSYDYPENAVFIIMTRGHENDYICLKALLDKKSRYIGMIGSKKKVKAIFDLLLKDGVSEEKIKEIHAPIGLEIGAKTPEEIAVSIAAQLLSMGIYSRDYSAVDEAVKNGGVLVTVIEKSGFAPCEIGSRMAVNGDKVIGTVGGGAMEHEAIEIAKTMEDNMTKEFDLSDGEAGSSGAVCGGKVVMRFERISK